MMDLLMLQRVVLRLGIRPDEPTCQTMLGMHEVETKPFTWK